MSNKKKLVVDYKTVPNSIVEAIARKFPDGITDGDYIRYVNAKGERVSAIPIETEDAYYLVKMGVELQEKVDEMDLDDIIPANTDDDDFDKDATTEDDDDGFADKEDKKETSYDDDDDDFDYKDVPDNSDEADED